jgi:hypothetical protein
MRNVAISFVGLGSLFIPALALAQPEPPPAPPPEPAPSAHVSTSAPAVAVAVAETKKGDETPDHEKVVGKIGVGYFGVTDLPIAVGPARQVTQGQVDTPVIGVRYWLKERIGIDGGVGLNFFSSGRTNKQNNIEVSTDGPAVAAFMLHVGVPIALAYGKHYKFLAVPEANFGYATQTESAQGGRTEPDIHRTGLRIDGGVRVGTEIQFGFIGIPQLSLQASVGLNFRHQRWGASQPGVNNLPETTSSITQTNFGTTVQADPWALFVNNVAAIYYFP